MNVSDRMQKAFSKIVVAAALLFLSPFGGWMSSFAVDGADGEVPAAVSERRALPTANPRPPRTPFDIEGEAMQLPQLPELPAVGGGDVPVCRGPHPCGECRGVRDGRGGISGQASGGAGGGTGKKAAGPRHG